MYEIIWKPKARKQLNKIGDRSAIRAWREYLGLTQKEVADKMGVSQAALSQMESGEKKLRKATLEKLAKAMGLSVEQLRE